MGRLQRDPVSELFDAAARRLLERAYSSPGRTAVTRLANPTEAQRQQILAAYGIDVTAPDDAGQGQARTRWGRAFLRAVTYQHRWYFTRGDHLRQQRRLTESPRPVKVTIGRALPVRGVIPAGRLVTVEIFAGGKAKAAAVSRLPASRRYITEQGTVGPTFNGGAAEAQRWGGGPQ